MTQLDDAIWQAPWSFDHKAARAELDELREQANGTPIDIVFDGPPSHESGRFVEVETLDGKSVNVGEWIQRPDGFWALRLIALLTARAKAGQK